MQRGSFMYWCERTLRPPARAGLERRAVWKRLPTRQRYRGPLLPPPLPSEANGVGQGESGKVASLRAINDVNLFSPSFLFASLIWGSIGVGYFIYGKKQQSLPAMVGGILMVVVSYFVGSALGCH